MRIVLLSRGNIADMSSEKARDTILDKQCYPISRNGTLITLRVVRIEFFAEM